MTLPKNPPIILPTKELTREWMETIPTYLAPIDHVAAMAALWGADQELEACCEWVGDGKRENLSKVIALRYARRPNPPTLKEQALSEVASAVAGGNITPERGAIIRLALEKLPQ